jgi:hypothetical protein
MIDHAESVRNFYRKQGAKAEQQRIIKLLEQEDKYTEHGQFNRKFFIALIKGESK